MNEYERGWSSTFFITLYEHKYIYRFTFLLEKWLMTHVPKYKTCFKKIKVFEIYFVFEDSVVTKYSQKDTTFFTYGRT